MIELKRYMARPVVALSFFKKLIGPKKSQPIAQALEVNSFTDSVEYFHTMTCDRYRSDNGLKVLINEFESGRFTSLRVESLTQTLLVLDKKGKLTNYLPKLASLLMVVSDRGIRDDLIHDILLFFRKFFKISTFDEKLEMQTIDSFKGFPAKNEEFVSVLHIYSGALSLYSTALKSKKIRSSFDNLFRTYISFLNVTATEKYEHTLNQLNGLRYRIENNFFEYDNDQKKYLLGQLQTLLSVTLRHVNNQEVESVRISLGTIDLFLSSKAELLSRDNFCIMPYLGVCVEPGGRNKPCCKFESWNARELASEHGLDSLIKTKYFKDIRDTQAKGRLHEGCLRCIEDDKQNISSMRSSYNNIYKNIFKSTDILSPKAKLADFGFGNICNAACITCHSPSSSMWYRDDKYLVDYQNNKFDRDLHSITKDNVHHWSDDELKNLKCVSHAQSEVLNLKQFEIFVDRMIQLDAAKGCRIEISTNAGYFVDDDLVDKVLHFKEVQIQFSIDATKEQFEYIRYPLKWDTVTAAVDRWAARTHFNENLELICRCTISLYNILYLDDLRVWWNKIRNNVGEYKSGAIQFGFVKTPEYLAIFNIPEHVKEYIRPYLTDQIAITLLNRKGDKTLVKTFIDFTKIMDSRRGTNFKETFSLLDQYLSVYRNDSSKLAVLTTFWAKTRSFEKKTYEKLDELEYYNIKDNSKLPYLKLDLPINLDLDRALEEIRSIKHLFVDHRPMDSCGWKSICLHGLDIDKTQAASNYGHTENIPYRWTELEDRCPYLFNFFKNEFPYKKYYRLRVMLLEPGGFILPHSDDDTSNLCPINIAINQPIGCEMVMQEHGVLPFEPGAAMWLDISNTHSVWNRSDEDRFVIIVHGEASDLGKEICVKTYDSYFSSDKRNIEKTTVTYANYDWNEYLHIEKDVKFFSFYDLDLAFEPSEIALALEYVKSGDKALSKIDELVKRLHFVDSRCDLELTIKEIHPTDSWMIESELNDIAVLLSDGPNEFDLTYSRLITYDLKDREDESFINQYKVKVGSFFAINFRGDSVIDNTSESIYYLVQIRAKKLYINSKASINRLITGKDNPSLLEEYTEMNLQRALKGFSANLTMLDSWHELGFVPREYYERLPEFIILNDNRLSKEIARELTEKHTLASLSPIVPIIVDADELSKVLRDSKKSAAVIMSAGCFINHLTRFIYECVRTSVSLEKENILLAGHLMDWSTSGSNDRNLPYLHEQFCILNIGLWNKLDCPNFESFSANGEALTSFPSYLASDEKVHDNYTPIKILRSEGEVKVGRVRWGTRLIQAALENQGFVINIPVSLRKTKSYCYPLHEDKSDFYEQEHNIEIFLMNAQSKVFTFNISRANYLPLKTFKPTQMISVASGWTPLFLARKHFDTLDESVFVDRSIRSLNYWREITRMPSYENLINRMKYASMSTIDDGESSIEISKLQYNEVLSIMHLEHDELMLLASRINPRFISGNFIDDENLIPNLVGSDKKSLIWISNAYYSRFAYHLYFLDELNLKFERMLKKIAILRGEQAYRFSFCETAGFVGDPENPSVVIADDNMINWENREFLINGSILVHDPTITK